jgi:protein phosphatase
MRAQNEDSIFFSCEPVGSLPNALIVSDGMGGHRAGEVASRMAIKFFCDFVRTQKSAPGELLDFLVSAVDYANEKIYGMSLREPSLYGMGATFSVCAVSGAKLYIAHIGDSRVYLSAGGHLSQLTNDHSFVNELVRAGQLTEAAARSHPRKNELTRALGVEAEGHIDGRVCEADGGILLLCSDGLTNMLTDEKIYSIVEGTGTLEMKARCLIAAANDNGGHDNISAILADLRR